jgi:hypothetical protein
MRASTMLTLVPGASAPFKASTTRNLPSGVNAMDFPNAIFFLSSNASEAVETSHTAILFPKWSETANLLESGDQERPTTGSSPGSFVITRSSPSQAEREATVAGPSVRPCIAGRSPAANSANAAPSKTMEGTAYLRRMCRNDIADLQSEGMSFNRPAWLARFDCNSTPSSQRTALESSGAFASAGIPIASIIASGGQECESLRARH